MPGLRGALAIRVSDGVTDRIVSRYCRGLKFTKTAPGGHQSISFKMVLPRNTFTDLGPADRCYLYDTRTARTIFDGYLENPTPTDGPDGQEYDVSAMGGMALLNDETRPLIYVDRDLGQFEKESGAVASSNIEVAEWESDPTYRRLRVQFPGGSVVAAGGVVGAGNYMFERAGMNLGAIRIGNKHSGKADVGNYAEDFVTTSGTVDTRGMTTTGVTVEYFVGATNFPTGIQRFALRLRRGATATNVADDTTWTNWVDYSVIGQRMDRNGILLTGSGSLVSASQVLASQVVEDLLGRLLTFCDPGTAQVDATSFGITQLAYPDGVKAGKVLDDLADFEPDYLHEILEALDNGKHRFNYRAWPTSPRYEVSVRDGWVQKGSDVDECNRIKVSWTDAAGATQVTVVTATSAGLTDPLPGRIKDADPVTLPEGKGSAANATRIGAQTLADKINPPKAGTVLVRRPILDVLTGNRVMPWEIEPGYPCRVRELGDDLRITEVDYDDDTCSALLTLGRPVLTEQQRLARLDRAAG